VFQYIWVDGTTVTVTIPDSYMEIKDINSYLQSIMVANKHYLTTASGDYVYLLEMVVNQARYAIQLNEYMISSTIATTNSWTLPSGATWVLPTNTIVPCFVILSTNNFGQIIGYSAGQYPSGTISGTPPSQTQTPTYTSAQSQLSSITPQVTPYSSFLVYCSLIDNKACIPSQLIYTYTPTNVSFGAIGLYEQKSELAWMDIIPGMYQQFSITIVDQLGRPVSFQDPNTTITLIQKNKFEDLIDNSFDKKKK